MPTGTGKTHVLAAVVKGSLTPTPSQKGEESNMPTTDEDGIKPVCGDSIQPCHEGYVWIVAHRRELVEQIEETLLRYGIDTADRQVKVLSIQWLSRHWDDAGPSPRLIIIDEAHHALARTYTELWEKYPKVKKLGMTATPCRMSQKGFTGLFETMVTSWSITEFIKKGILSLFDYISIRPDSNEQQLIDSLEKRGTDGDYQLKEMNEVLNRKPSIEKLYRSIERFAPGKKGIVYAISIGHARRIAEYYNRKGVNAAAIDSKTAPTERKQLVEAFKNGSIKVLVNVDVFSEGFDCPDVEFIQMARPTLSLSKYLQQVGRGLRKAERKDTCILIDNVGLYRVFGLPTVTWDWESMFRGLTAGKGKSATRLRNEYSLSCLQHEEAIPILEMEMVMSHDRLLEEINKQRYPDSIQTERKPKLNIWLDKPSGMYGLRLGRTQITDAIFVIIFDIRYDMAAVKFRSNRCGIINNSGEVVCETVSYNTMRFTKDYMLIATAQDSTHYYIDLHNFRLYDRQPVVKRYGKVELLKVGNIYYSRTRTVYMNSQNINDDYINRHRFYLSIFDSNVPPSCGRRDNPFTDNFNGFVCLLDGDNDSYYWIYRRLADGSIIIMDKNKQYYHAEDGNEKKYIGCGTSEYEYKKCMGNIERAAKLAQEKNIEHTKEKNKLRLQALKGLTDITPFRTGMKWGLKSGERIIVPPIYRNVRPPVGRYCAVEVNYSQWGVIAIDGTVMVEAKYPKVEIKNSGTVLLTSVTGAKLSVKLDRT